ncbi:FRG domain-containing protein [Rubrolithibacter danxiaensis]|uniref:FRG domain-containing protein n=1 Tax=Rubrolithibacter danxiaensis TaxID=3390805 RepID=UPI003BF87B01
MAKEEEIQDVQEYLKIVKLYKKQNLDSGNEEDFLFRGQQTDQPLIPKIARLRPHGDLVIIEKIILNEFKRTNPLLIEAQKAIDDWDYLTLGQHFGLPTRFLDWTNNALTALWFATNNYGNPNNEYGVVWVLMAEKLDFILDASSSSPFDVSKTRVFRPRIIKQRINNQSGVFSIHTTEDIIHKNELNTVPFFKNKLLKIKIPSNHFQEIREDLNTLGVNDFTIFPELEGLCSYLQWRYFS